MKTKTMESKSMKILGNLICLVKGHIPIHDGHVTGEVYGYFFAPDFQKLSCARCGSTVHLINNAVFDKKIEREQLSERCIRSLKLHKMLGDSS